MYNAGEYKCSVQMYNAGEYDPATDTLLLQFA